MTTTQNYTYACQLNRSPTSSSTDGNSGVLQSYKVSMSYSGSSVSRGGSVTWNFGGSQFSATYSGYVMPGGGPIMDYNGVYYGLTNTDYSPLSTIQPVAESTFPCYCPGTLIATDDGEVAIETLSIGDLVRTASGALRPIKWIGRRAYAGHFAQGNRDLQPILIQAGALADGAPHTDLHVSPLHAMFIDDLLVPAKHLVNGVTIRQVERETVEYIHLELDSHDVILANGAPSESFLDDDSRMMFRNAHEFAALYPDEPVRPALYCAPRVTDGFAVEAIRQRLGRRAGTRAEPAALPLIGAVDHVSGDLIRGWAMNPDRPDAPVCLDILLDGVVVTQTLANAFCPDLQAAYGTSGCHAFELRLPTAGRSLAVRRSLDGRALSVPDRRAA